MEAQPVYRYRLTFGKGKPIKYLAHLDIVLGWTRVFRRANVPLAYTAGFNPQARIQVAASLPVGTTGSAELMDIYLSRALDPADLLNGISATLPPGYSLTAVEAVDLRLPILQAALRRAEYTVTVETDLPVAELQARIEALLGAETAIQTRVRRQKEEVFDLRPLLHGLTISGQNENGVILLMDLHTGQAGNLRPETVLQALGLNNDWNEINRTKLIFDI